MIKTSPILGTTSFRKITFEKRKVGDPHSDSSFIPNFGKKQETFLGRWK